MDRLPQFIRVHQLKEVGQKTAFLVTPKKSVSNETKFISTLKLISKNLFSLTDSVDQDQNTYSVQSDLDPHCPLKSYISSKT